MEWTREEFVVRRAEEYAGVHAVLACMHARLAGGTLVCIHSTFAPFSTSTAFMQLRIEDKVKVKERTGVARFDGGDA